MWYAVIGAAGLSVGLALMGWALLEREKRHRAERIADECRRKETEATMLADAAHHTTTRLQGEASRMTAQLAYVRERLMSARDILRDHAPMPMVKQWLDDEGKGGKV